MHKLSLQRWKGAEKELQLLQHVWHIELQCVYSPNSPWSDQWVQFICGFWQTQNVKSSLLPKGHPHSPLLWGSRGDERRGVVPAASAAVSLGSCCLSFTALLFCIWDNLGVNMDLVGERSRAFNLSGWKCERRARLTSIFFKRALFIKKQKQNWYLSSCCPVRLCCCYNVASVCCQLQHQHPPHTIKPQSPWWCTWHRYQHHKHIHKQTQSQNKQNPTVSLDSLFVFCRSVYSN